MIGRSASFLFNRVVGGIPLLLDFRTANTPHFVLRVLAPGKSLLVQARLAPPGWCYKYAAGPFTRRHTNFPSFKVFIISFPVNTSPLLPGSVSSEEPTPSEPLKGTPYRKWYFFIRHRTCRPVHESGISPSPRGSAQGTPFGCRRAASRRKYHCQNSSVLGRSRCKRYCTLKDFPLGN